jgi:hypothetical protein
METTDIQSGFSGQVQEAHSPKDNTATIKISIFHYAIKYGLTGGIACILLFLLFKVMGLIESLGLSFVNFIILAFVSFKALKDFKEEAYKQHGKMNYIQGYGTAFFTSAISFALLSLFMFFYLTYLDKNFMSYIQTKDIAGLTINPSSISIALFFEGTSMGIIIALVSMQYFKK